MPERLTLHSARIDDVIASRAFAFLRIPLYVLPYVTHINEKIFGVPWGPRDLHEFDIMSWVTASIKRLMAIQTHPFRAATPLCLTRLSAAWLTCWLMRQPHRWDQRPLASWLIVFMCLENTFLSPWVVSLYFSRFYLSILTPGSSNWGNRTNSLCLSNRRNRRIYCFSKAHETIAKIGSNSLVSPVTRISNRSIRPHLSPELTSSKNTQYHLGVFLPSPPRKGWIWMYLSLLISSLKLWCGLQVVPRTTSQIPQDPRYFLSNMKILSLSHSLSPKHTEGFSEVSSKAAWHMMASSTISGGSACI